MEPVVMTALAALAVSVVGVLAGELWSLMLEDRRVGNGHLSYRVDRIPWTQHRLGFFLGGAVLIGLTSGFQYYRARLRGTDNRTH